MNLELFIARRAAQEETYGHTKTRRAANISIVSTAIATIVMIVAIAICSGFKAEIRHKLAGFGAHLTVKSSAELASARNSWLDMDSMLVDRIAKTKGVRHVQRVCQTNGMLKTADDIEGITLKGVDEDFDWSFFADCMTEGSVLSISRDSVCKGIVMSQRLSQKLGIKLGDKARLYFVIDDKVRVRQFDVEGIYNSGFTDMDDVMLIADSRIVRRLYSLEETNMSALEIVCEDFDAIEAVHYDLLGTVANRFDSDGNPYILRSIHQDNPQMFSWLEMLDINVVITLVLMIAVAGFTIASGLLIHILDKVSMIGLLFCLGMTCRRVRKIFFMQSALTIGKGMAIGNVVGIAICLIQQLTHVVPLNPENYYVDFVPMALSPLHIVLLNIGIAVAASVILIIPTHVVSKVSPSETIRFE